MEEGAENKGEADVDPGILQCVHLLEGQRLEDGHELADSHADDDVDGAHNEGIGKGPLEVSLQKGIKSPSEKKYGIIW